MKKTAVCIALVGLLALGGQAIAEIGTIDDVPAATLMVPYFEVDLNDPNQNTTLFSINNASAAPAIAHVVLWTDLSVPTLDFNVFLTGYDVYTVNLRDLFTTGAIPPSSANNVAISPRGIFSLTTNPISGVGPGSPGCADQLPIGNLPASVVAHLIAAHTGQGSGIFGGLCSGIDYGDNIARGYVTVDNANFCNLRFPTDCAAGYFIAGGLGDSNNINQLWGDWFMVDTLNNFAQGDTLVHIEANSNFDALQIPLLDPDTGVTVTTVANATGYTFYGRYFVPPTGPDNREPLGTIWGTRYLNGGVFDQTRLIVWRDSTADDIAPPPNQSWCNGAGPSWFPLNETEVIAFNEAEDAVEICFFTGGFVSPPDESDPPCFPWETHLYNWGEGDLSVPFNFGWAWLNLNLPPDAPIGDADFGSDGNIAQSYVTTTHSALGLFSVGLQAVQLYDACQDYNQFLNGAIENGGVNIID